MPQVARLPVPSFDSASMRISAKLAHQLNNDIQEAMGALDLALIAEDVPTKDRRITQSKNAMRKTAELIAAHTVRWDAQ